jgi:hypothetical protein
MMTFRTVVVKCETSNTRQTQTSISIRRILSGRERSSRDIAKSAASFVEQTHRTLEVLNLILGLNRRAAMKGGKMLATGARIDRS